MDQETFPVYERPLGDQIPLPIPPRLASWDARTHPSQLRLDEYLESVERLVDALRLPDQGLALSLTVGLSGSTDLLTGGRDLDNYIFPVIQRLGSNRFVSVWAEKKIGEPAIALDEARPIQPDLLLAEGWSHFVVRTTTSASTAAWKHEIANQFVDVAQAPEGALELQLSFLLGPSRSWVNLWKPAIDALEQILGRGPRPFHPRDDRITLLGLHRRTDVAMRFDCAIGVWWRSVETLRSGLGS